MRVAVVANTAWYLYNFRLSLMRALREDGHAVTAVAPFDAYAERIRAEGFEFEDVAISGAGTNPFRELGTVMRLRSTLRRAGADVIVSFTPKGNIYSALASAATSARWIPNISGLGRAFIRRSAITTVVKALYRLTLRRAERVYFQNADDMAAFVADGLVAATRALRLPGSGVDLRRFSPVPLPGTQARESVFLLIARMMWDKGVGEYVQAAREVRATHPYARFHLLGAVDVANPSAISMRQMTDWVAEGCVEYLGQTDDVRPFIAAADCVVLPSYREGVPRTLLEAAAMGRPVIATDVPGCRAAVDDGLSGLLCRPRDAGDLARQMRGVLEMDQAALRRMGEAGRAKMEREFDERLVIDAYRELIGRGAGHLPRA